MTFSHLIGFQIWHALGKSSAEVCLLLFGTRASRAKLRIALLLQKPQVHEMTLHCAFLSLLRAT